jgi:hypothetical protein
MPAGDRLQIVIDADACRDMDSQLTESHLVVLMLSVRTTQSLFDLLTQNAGANNMHTVCSLLALFDVLHMGRPLFNFMDSLPICIRNRIHKIAEFLLCKLDVEKLQHEADKVDAELRILSQITMVDVSMVRLQLDAKRADIVREMERIQEHIAVLLA